MDRRALALAVLAAAGGMLLFMRGAQAAMNTTGSGQVAGGQVGNQSQALLAYQNFRTFDGLFIAAGQKWGVDPMVLKAIALQESSLNPRAANVSNPADPSYGLMQMSCMPDGHGGCLANEFNLVGWPPASAAALFDPAISVDLGAQLLAQNLRATGGDYAHAIAMYNSGSTYDPAYVAAVQQFYSEMGGGQL